MYRKIEPHINKAKVSYSREIFVCKLKMRCVSPDSSVVLLFFINEIIHSLKLCRCVWCAGTLLGARKQQKDSLLRSDCSQSTTWTTQANYEHNSCVIMCKKKCASAVIGSGPGSCVTHTQEEPDIQPQGIRKAPLKEHPENQRLRRSWLTTGITVKMEQRVPVSALYCVNSYAVFSSLVHLQCDQKWYFSKLFRTNVHLWPLCPSALCSTIKSFFKP